MGINSNLDTSGHRNVNVDDSSFQGNLDEVELPLEQVERKKPKVLEEAPKRRTKKDKD